MTTVHIIDDSEMLTELLGSRLSQMDYEITITTDPGKAIEQITAPEAGQTCPDVTIVDLSFPQHALNGLDVLMAVRQQCVDTKLVIYTQGDNTTSDILALAWDVLKPTCCVSKLSPFNVLASRLGDIVAGRIPSNDPALEPYLSRERSPWRTTEAYARLVPHGGHAKMWQGLFDADEPPTYQELSGRTGLAVNTLRNYREDLVAELELQGWTDFTLRSMHQFAASRRPLLAPFVTAKQS